MLKCSFLLRGGERKEFLITKHVGRESEVTFVFGSYQSFGVNWVAFCVMIALGPIESWLHPTTSLISVWRCHLQHFSTFHLISLLYVTWAASSPAWILSLRTVNSAFSLDNCWGWGDKRLKNCFVSDQFTDECQIIFQSTSKSLTSLDLSHNARVKKTSDFNSALTTKSPKTHCWLAGRKEFFSPFFAVRKLLNVENYWKLLNVCYES